MRYVVAVARCLLGALFIVFGLNTFLWAVSPSHAFMKPPPPSEMPAAAASFLQALTDTGFVHALRGGAEFVAGLMVFTGIMAPLGLLVLAPIIVHIVLYHHFLDANGTVFSYVILTIWLFLVFAYAPSFRGLLQPFAKSRWSRMELNDSNDKTA